jgi:hypothetical protein
MTNGQWHGGKGSGSRPLSVTQEEYDNRWDAIFGRKPVNEESSDTEDEENEDNELDDEDADTEDTE